MRWINDRMQNIWSHLGEILTVALLLIGNMIGVVRLFLRAETHETRLTQLELDWREHSQDSTMHRTPDFERRLTDLSDLIREIKHDVKQLLKQERSQ
jgi:hypothetical protein